MQFVILFGQGRFLSRHVHQVILDIIDRAMRAFSATGMDPDRYQFSCLPACSVKLKLMCSLNVCRILPSDDWFIDVAQESISRIGGGRARVANGDREVNSPTASVSAQSVSSVRSLGSS